MSNGEGGRGVQELVDRGCSDLHLALPLIKSRTASSGTGSLERLKFGANKRSVCAILLSASSVLILAVVVVDASLHHAHRPTPNADYPAPHAPHYRSTGREGSEVVRYKQFTGLDKVTCEPSAFGKVEEGFVTHFTAV